MECEARKESTYPIDIPAEPSAGVPRVVAEFGRITVILGSNGTGKSRVLKRLQNRSSGFGESNRPVVYIEGGRVAALPNNLQYDHNTYNEFGTGERARNTFRSRRLTTLSARSKDPFYLLQRRGDDAKSRHSDEIVAWEETGELGPRPQRAEAPMKGLFRMFSEVFPELALELDEGEGRNFWCVKNGNRYPVLDMSDGERQSLFVLADIALAAESNSLVIVDEPELNLNPQLGERLWDTIEARLPEAIFVYATHNIGFAMRRSVDQIIALSGHGQPALQIKSIADLDRAELVDFLGAIPAILAAQSAVLVEGTDTSFDAKFYAWILARSDVAVVPLGDCNDVRTAATKTGVWARLAPSVKLVGIIDRDFWDEDAVKKLQQPPCIVTAFHEAESYLCHPEVFASIAHGIGTADPMPRATDIDAAIRAHFEKNLVRIACKRMSARASIRLGVSIENSVFSTRMDDETLLDTIRVAATAEICKAGTKVGPEIAVVIYNEEIQRCRKALKCSDISDVLRLCPGKELLRQLAPKAGCKDSDALARGAYKHLTPRNFVSLEELRVQIERQL